MNASHTPLLHRNPVQTDAFRIPIDFTKQTIKPISPPISLTPQRSPFALVGIRDHPLLPVFREDCVLRFDRRTLEEEIPFRSIFSAENPISRGIRMIRRLQFV